jgi:hypothetical protein
LPVNPVLPTITGKPANGQTVLILRGHGFAEAIFDGYDRSLLLKLYRCPDCGYVIRLRPQGYFKRFQTQIETIPVKQLRKQKNGHKNSWRQNWMCVFRS